MIFYLVLIFELLILFFTSKTIVQALYTAFFRIFKKHALIPVYILFFPGVVIHELSHFIIAEVLFVKVHDIDLTPEVKDGRIRLGSVQIRQTDIVRKLIIGAAPVLVGLFLLFVIVTYFVGTFETNFLMLNILKTVFMIWLLFAITNTMFSSKQDMEGFIEFLAVGGFFLLVVVIALLIAKIDFISPIFSALLNAAVIEVVKRGSSILFIPLLINAVCFAGSKMLLKNNVI